MTSPTPFEYGQYRHTRNRGNNREDVSPDPKGGRQGVGLETLRVFCCTGGAYGSMIVADVSQFMLAS